LQFDDVSYGERVSFSLSSQDQLNNFREAVWSVSIPGDVEVRDGPGLRKREGLVKELAELRDRQGYCFGKVTCCCCLLQRLGALSSNNSVSTYDVPAKNELQGDQRVSADDGGAMNFTVTFSLLSSEVSSSTELTVEGCHPGYYLDPETQKCVCSNDPNIVRCDQDGRYFYARVSPDPMFNIGTSGAYLTMPTD
jgi:hypothetical protein